MNHITDKELIKKDLIKNGSIILKENNFFNDLDNIMNDYQFRFFYNKYFNDISDIKTVVLYMKLYETIQKEYKEKNGIDIESELLIYIIKELMSEDCSRKNILNSFQSFIENNNSNKKFLLDIFEKYDNITLSINMKKIPCYLILLFVILLIIIFICIIKKYNYNENFDNQNSTKYMTYYRCKDKMLSKIIKNIFDNNNIIHSNNDWNIYIPCGYNNVESELKDIKIDNINNKYIFGINGCDSIVSKNQIWESLVKCYGRKHASTLMPESYVLDDPNEMMLFRKNFNPSGTDIYIMKKNLQRKEGLKLTKDFFEILNGSS